MADKQQLLRRRQIIANTSEPGLLYKWDFTKSLNDSVRGLGAIDNSQSTALIRDSSGLHFNAISQEIVLPWVYTKNRAFEVDTSSFIFSGVSNYHIRFIMFGINSGSDVINNTTTNCGFIFNKSNQRWELWWTNWFDSFSDWAAAGSRTAIVGTVRIELDNDWHIKIYVNGNYIGQCTSKAFTYGNETRCLRIGNADANTAGGQFYTATVTGARVYSLTS